jgi:hypothetical protein
MVGRFKGFKTAELYSIFAYSLPLCVMDLSDSGLTSTNSTSPSRQAVVISTTDDLDNQFLHMNGA